MKKFFTALLSLIFLLYPLSPVLSRPFSAKSAFHAANVTAQADQPDRLNGYACICTNNVYFYAIPNDARGIFILPKTYYVKILDYQPDYCKIEYLYDDVATQKIIGYVKTDQLTFVDYTPRRPYLYYVFEVEYHIGESDLNDSAFLDKLTATCAYYGDYKLGATTYCYVLRGDTFGYIPKPQTLSYEENTEYADYLASKQETPVDSSFSQSQSSSPAQIAILIALCLLVPILAALIIKPPKRPPYDSEL